jgi:membrane associated rhomboid family serine protease
LASHLCRHLITILTSMFMHASWSHIVGNMVFLWAFGPQIEDAMGTKRYSAFYLAGGVVPMLAQVAVDPGSTIPSLGASGAIAAVMGAFLVTYPSDRIRTSRLPSFSTLEMLRRFGPIPYQIGECWGMSGHHGRGHRGTARRRTAEGHSRVH